MRIIAVRGSFPVLRLDAGVLHVHFPELARPKRYTELFGARSRGQTPSKLEVAAYYPQAWADSSLGAASGYLSVMVLAVIHKDQKHTVLIAIPQIICSPDHSAVWVSWS